MTEYPETTESAFDRFNQWRRNSLALKLITIGILILILLIPLQMIESLISERKVRKIEAEYEVGETWGGRQVFTGPILTVPYLKTANETTTSDQLTESIIVRQEIQYAHFLPEKLNITSEVDPMVRNRGVYDILVYDSELSASGEFARPDFSGWPGVGTILWDNAFVSLGVSDLSAVSEEVRLMWGDSLVEVSPGVTGSDILNTGMSAPVRILPSETGNIPFQANLHLRGHSSLRCVPVGKVTEMRMSSTWPSPSFTGAFLPETEPEVGPDGFSAYWKVFHLNRNYPQRFRGAEFELESSSFGTDLLITVDEYQQSERSAKYGVLLVSLVFLMFFFSQALNGMRIHFVQYLLVGLALSLFYLLLVSFSEHIGFSGAYLVGALATSGLVTLYFRAITGNWKLASMLLFLLAFLFVFIYVIIQMEDFALLTGSIGLFIILAVIMYLSRKVDWYSIGIKSDKT